MKQQSNNPGKSKAPNTGHNKRPDIRDDIDSRKNEEQEFKGKHTTHNKKETQGSKRN